MAPLEPRFPRIRAAFRRPVQAGRAAAWPLACLLVLSLVGCTGPSLGGPSGTASPGATASSPSESRPASARGTTLAAEDLRFLFTCSHVDASPDLSVYSLEEVWASTGYVRIESCDVEYRGPEPYMPRDRELDVIVTADPSASRGQPALDIYLEAARLCTRVPETGPGSFEAAGRELLEAAVKLCPEAPQGRLLAAWATGERFADGDHAVGADVAPGSYGAVEPDASCSWNVTGDDGRAVASGGAPESASVDLQDGAKISSDNCGIWGKMY